LAAATSWEDALRAYSTDDYDMLLAQLGGSTAQLQPEQFLSSLWNRQNEDGFAKILDNTLIDIAASNSRIFSVKTDDGELVRLFDPVTEYVASKRNEA
jgi:type I restriction enzyme M protein